jgi:poly(A) polymerase
MRTSREIYHWIRWDPRFDPAEFAVGYDDHGGAPKEIALVAFVPDGEIPWHRVLYLRRGRSVVWDRRTGLDRVAPDAERSVVRWPSYTRWTPIDPVRRADASGEGRASDGSLSVLTFNVLDEQHVPAHLVDPRRFDALIATIAQADADVVVLQEVTGAFARRMSESSIINSAYDVSHALASDSAQSVLLLSRLPVRWAGALRFSSHKSAIALGVEHETGPAIVAGVHLPSDWARDSRDLRCAYLRALVAALDDARALTTVIAGDFNEGDESDFADELSGFADAWRLAGKGRGDTWEPARNALAAHASRQGAARRLDRVWVRSSDNALAVARAEVLPPVSLDVERSLYASDHWPLRVAIESGVAAPSAPFERDPSAALVALLSDELSRELEPIRRAHDDSAGRWPAHVTVMHPWVARSDRHRAAELLRAMLSERDLLALVIRGAGHFESARERVVYLRVESAELASIERELRASPALARCFEREGFTAHITVARGAKDDRALSQLERALDERFAERRFTARELVWLARAEDSRMVPLARFAIGRDAEARRAHAASVVNDAIATMLGEGEADVVWPIGSHAMGAADEESDLDLLAVVPSWCEPALFYEEAAAALGRIAGVERVQVIDSATVAIVRCVVRGVEVDLQRASRPARDERRGPAHYTESDLDSVDPDSRRALLSAMDAQALRAAVERAGVTHTYSTLVRRVKRWARARQLAGQAYGWMGGLAYAVLAAASAIRSRASDEDEAFAAFFEHFAGWGGESAVSLGSVGSWVRSARDVLPVLAPASPLRNVTRSMTPSTRSHWRDEVSRARALVMKGALDRVDETITDAPKHAVTVRVYASDERATSVAKARGFVEGRMVRAVMALDERGLRPRPLPSLTNERGASVSFVLGLRTGASPAARADFERAFEDAPVELELEW